MSLRGARDEVGRRPVGQSGEKGAASRALAARAVLRVLERGETLEAALAGIDSSTLDDRDRAHVQALAFGAVRWHHRHTAILGVLLDRPVRSRDRILEALLSVGLFQLADPEQPDYAAVSATVAAARMLGHERAAGLINASLRRYQRESAAIRKRVLAADEARYSHPAWLIDRLREDWPDRWVGLLEANQRHPPLWLRINLRRTSVADYQARLQAELGVAATTLPGAPQALKIATPVPAGRLPGFAEGLVSVQDAASQLASAVLDPQPGMRVLDACAAPGGKTTHLLEHGAGAIDVTALDTSAERLQLVASNLSRLGQAARLITGDATTPAQWWDGEPFDRILVDAPCSATGVIRRHPDIKLLRRPEDLPALAARQSLMLERLWPLLRPGGRLLYSTCSILREENAGVTDRFLDAHPQARPLPVLAGLPEGALAGAGPGLQLLPGSADTDGFYYALMERATG